MGPLSAVKIGAATLLHCHISPLGGSGTVGFYYSEAGLVYQTHVPPQRLWYETKVHHLFKMK